MMNKFRAVDLFCGGGGLSQGLQNAGIEIVAAFDNWKSAIKFYKANIAGHPVEELDLLDSNTVSDTLRKFDFNMIVGGPPCQDFSSAGKRDEKGGRANLTISFAETISILRPEYFIMENVDRAQKTITFVDALSIFRKSGYGLTVTILDASLCGVPQRRKRVIVFGILNGADNAMIEAIQKYQSDKPMTMRDYFGNKLEIEYYYRHPRSYSRRAVFSIDEPSPTIRGVNRPIPQGYPGHAGDAAPITEELRPLTTKERSLIQTFPESWNVSGAKSEIEQIVGNAVPVKLGEFIGKCFLESISSLSVNSKYIINDKQPWTLFEQRCNYSSSNESEI
jgi:DNA (cytosine-5)-methyltransferase 1